MMQLLRGVRDMVWLRCRRWQSLGAALWNIGGVLIGGLVSLSCVAAHAAQATQATVAPASASTLAANMIHEQVLANGLKVIVKEDHRAPTIAHMIWYRVGSVDEVNGVTGVAHVLEHMMFKGTRSLKAGEFSRRVAALGGRENAFTSRDYTAYFQQIHKSNLAEMMRMEADRMQHLVVSEADFSKEIKVVMEERRWRTEDRAQSRVYEALMAAALQAHPYRTPTVGWMSDLQTMQVADVRAFYQRWYAPNNAVLIVTGDVQAKEVFALAQRYYGVIPKRSVPTLTERKAQTEPPQVGLRRIEVQAPAENPYLLIAVRVPKIVQINATADNDAYALEVLAAVLDGYSGARLTTRLVREQRLADQVGAGYDAVARGPAFFMLDGTPSKGKTTAELEQALLSEVERIAKEGVDQAELTRVTTQLIASQIYKRDSIFAQAMEIAGYEMSGFSHRDIDTVLQRLQAVTPADVQRVAARYFKRDQMTIATLLPQPIDPNKLTEKPKGLRH